MNKGDDQTSGNKTGRMTLIIACANVLLTLAAIAVALIIWLNPFKPIEPSPLYAPKPPESRITCSGNDVEYSSYRWRISGSTECTGSLQSGETLVGYSTSLSNVSDQGQCAILAFTGPSSLPPLPLSTGELSLHSGSLPATVIDALLIGARNDLREAAPSCDQRGIFELRLPLSISIPGYLEEGVHFLANLPGLYSISIVDGAYSSFPDTYAQAEWRTRLNIYHNRPIEWGGRLRREPSDDPSLTYNEPTNPDAIIGIEESPDRETSITAGLSAPPVYIRLRAGDTLTLVPIDDAGWYSRPGPNAGVVVVQVSLLSP